MSPSVETNLLAAVAARRRATAAKDARVLAAIGRGSRLRALECELDLTTREIRRSTQRLRRAGQLQVAAGSCATGGARRWVPIARSS